MAEIRSSSAFMSLVSGAEAAAATATTGFEIYLPALSVGLVPSVGEVRLDSSYGVLALLLGRVIPAGLASVVIRSS